MSCALLAHVPSHGAQKAVEQDLASLRSPEAGKKRCKCRDLHGPSNPWGSEWPKLGTIYVFLAPTWALFTYMEP